MRIAATLLAILVLTPERGTPTQAGPLGDGFQEDPLFPIQALFGRTDNRREWAVRTEDATLVVLGGPGRDWFVGWDLVTGQQKYRVRAPHLSNNVDHREMGPTGKFLFFLPKEEPGKDGRSPRMVNYFDTTTGKLARTASFDVTSPPQYKVQGNTLDERALIQRFGGGFHPKQTALQSFIRPLASNRGLLIRSATPDLLHVVATDPDLKSLYVLDAEKPKVVAEIPMSGLGVAATDVVNSELSADRSTLILTAGLSFAVVDLPKKKIVRSLVGHSKSIFSGFRLSPDATRLLSASLDGSARIWDVPQGKELAQVFTDRGAEEVGFLTAGEKAGYVVDEHSVRLLKYDGSLMRTVGTFLSSRAELTEDGSAALDGLDGTKQTTYRFWKLDPPQVLAEHRIPGRRGFTALSADGRTALIQADDQFLLLDSRNPDPLWTGKLDGVPVGVLPGGAVLMIRKKSIVAVDVQKEEPRWTSEFPEIRFARVNGSGTHVLVVGAVPHVIESAQGRKVTDDPPAAYRLNCSSAVLSRDGSVFVTYDENSGTFCWQTVSGGVVRTETLPKPQSGQMALSPDGRRLYWVTPMKILVFSSDKGLEKTVVMSSRILHEIRMTGDFAVIERSGGSALLRYAAPGGK